MLAVFEVYLVPGADGSELLSAETVRATAAQIMTLDEGQKVGVGGLPAPPPGKDVRLGAVGWRARAWMHRALEGSVAVAGCQGHEGDG